MFFLDSLILDATERVCRRFQLLTGRTNVWLAMQLTNISIIVYFVWAALGQNSAHKPRHLLPLVPLVQVAWVEGGVSPQERAMIVDLARKRGVTEGSEADRLLSDWLAERPDQAVFERASRLIRAMLEAGSQETRDLSPDDLVKYCESIASASGGLLGIGRVSSEERALLGRIAAQLKSR